MKRKGGAAFDFVFVSILREKNYKKDNSTLFIIENI